MTSIGLLWVVFFSCSVGATLDRSAPKSPARFRFSDAPRPLRLQLNCSTYAVHEEFVRLDNGSLLLPGTGELHSDNSYILENGTAILCDEGSPDGTEYPVNFTKEFLTCGHFFLEPNEFEILNGDRVYVEAYSKTYGLGDYHMADGGVYVCVPTALDHPQNGSSNESLLHGDYFDKFPESFGYLTHAGLALSVICLLAHLAVFCAVQSARNLPGYCLASLSLSLLVAYVCFSAVALVGDSGGCLELGLCVYYFFLCAFFWMNAIAFDVWRSFRVVVRELRITGHRVPWRRFLAYSAYSWLVPALLTSLVRLGDTTDVLPVGFRPDFGKTYCWFGKRTALLVFFAAPLGCVLVLNAAFFLDVTYVISRASVRSNQEGAARKRFFMFLRLALLMGLTWVVGLVAGYADNVVMWYLFILLNTLQGFFIFVVFSFGSKVKQQCFGRRVNLHRSSTSVRTISQVSATV